MRTFRGLSVVVAVSLAMIGSFMVSLTASAKSKKDKQTPAASAAPLALYGVEMTRQDAVMLKDFKNYARAHGRAEFVVSKSSKIDYEGTGDVILADYTTDKDAAEKTAAEIPGGAKVLEIRVQPSLTSKRNVSVYKLPLLKTEDSVLGDIWIQAGSNPPQKIESGVVMSSSKPNIANLFKLVGFSDKGSWLVYCLDECVRYDLVTASKSPQEKINNVEASGIRRSIDNLLDKDKSCSKKLTFDFMQNADINGYYRGICPAKKTDNVLEVRLKRDSGRWQVVNSSWMN